MRSSSVVRRDISVQTYLGTIAEGIHLASALRLFLWQREELHPAPLCGAQSSTTRARAGSAELEAVHQEGWKITRKTTHQRPRESCAGDSVEKRRGGGGSRNVV